MKMKHDLLSHINMTRLVKLVLFNTSDVAPDIETKASKGIRDIERIVVEMFSQEMLQYAIRLDDAAEIIGISPKETRRNIRKAIKIGQEFYDGTYGRPCDIEPEQAVYIVTALAIQEYGRKSDDISEYVVRKYISDYLDIGSITSEYDMSCYVFLIEYFEHCLTYGKVSITKFLKTNANPFVTSRRLNNFMKRNDWYGDAEDVDRAIGLYTAQPRLSDVTNALLNVFDTIRECELSVKEEYDLNHAFNS